MRISSSRLDYFHEEGNLFHGPATYLHAVGSLLFSWTTKCDQAKRKAFSKIERLSAIQRVPLQEFAHNFQRKKNSISLKV
jgi:hypothetical protein